MKKGGTLALATLLISGVLALYMWLGARRVDRWFADADATYAHVTILGRDAGPGDEIGIRVIVPQEIVITGAHAQIGGARFDAADTGWDDVAFTARIPETATGELAITVKVDISIAGVFSRSETIDTLPMTLTVRGDRALRHAIDVGLAGLAWVVAAALAYAIVRWRPVGDREVAAGATQLVARIALIGIAAIGVLGHLVFVRPLQRTLPSTAALLPLVLILIWGLALAIGCWLGERARSRDLRWWKAWLRPVIGTPPLTDAFRGAGSTLPPSLSRDVDAQPLDKVHAALVAVGFAVAGRVITVGGEEVARLAKHVTAARPEQLGLEVIEDFDATPLARALTGLYGPLEIRSRFTPATIVDPG